MIQYPVNVRPDNITFDVNSETPENRRMQFKFKGDYLQTYAVRIYDFDTGELACADRVFYDYNTATMAFNNMAYNNDTIINDNIFNGGACSNGKKYIMQLLLVNSTMVSAGWNADMFVCRGTIQEDYTIPASVSDPSLVTLEKGIEDIYKWDLDLNNTGKRTPMEITTPNNVTYRLMSMDFVINGEKKLIREYDYTTGVAKLNGALSTAYPKGTPFQIYADYLISEQYLFRTASEPTIANNSYSVTWYASGFRFNAKYSQQQDIPMKCYKIQLYQVRDSTRYLIKTTEDIYSQKIEYRFTEDYNMEGMGGNYESKQYQFIITVVMQDGLQYKYTSPVFTQPDRSGEIITNVTVHNNLTEVNNGLYVSWDTVDDTPPCSFKIYRQELNDNPISWQTKELVYDTGGNYGGFNDFTIPNQGRFRYMIVPYQDNVTSEYIENATQVYESVLTNAFTLNMDGYTITAITDTGYEADGKPLFSLGNTYKFYIDVDSGTITQNTDKTLHVGYGKYSSLTSTKSEYLSGTLSGLLGYVECPQNEYTETPERIREWRKFITQDCQYILRTPKGDVWVVNITDNPTTEYLADTPNNPTKFSFSWAECCDINEILVTSSQDETHYPKNKRKRSD